VKLPVKRDAPNRLVKEKARELRRLAPAPQCCWDIPEKCSRTSTLKGAGVTRYPSRTQKLSVWYPRKIQVNIDATGSRFDSIDLHIRCHFNSSPWHTCLLVSAGVLDMVAVSDEGTPTGPHTENEQSIKVFGGF